MTRFLSRVLGDPQCGGLNEETKRLFAYHQATKHTYQSVRTMRVFWIGKPARSLRRYEGAPLITLPAEAGFPRPVRSPHWRRSRKDREQPRKQRRVPRRSSARRDLAQPAALAFHGDQRVEESSAYGQPLQPAREPIVRKSSPHGNPPGAARVRGPRRWLVSLPRGSPRTRASQSRRLTQRLARALMIPWAAESPLIVGLTSIFWREAWKYRDRAYRYCCHDMGHAMISLLLAARALGLPGGAIAHFSDFRLTRALGLTGGDEAPMAFLVFRRKALPGDYRRHPRKHLQEFPTSCQRRKCLTTCCSKFIARRSYRSCGPAAAHTADECAYAGDQPSLLSLYATPRAISPWTNRAATALGARFDARTPPMERNQVEQLLDFATRDWRADWRGNFGGETTPVGKGVDFVTLYLYIHRVRDGEPGVYRWDRTSRSLEQLHRANVERVAAYLSSNRHWRGIRASPFR